MVSVEEGKRGNLWGTILSRMAALPHNILCTLHTLCLLEGGAFFSTVNAQDLGNAGKLVDAGQRSSKDYDEDKDSLFFLSTTNMSV